MDEKRKVGNDTIVNLTGQPLNFVENGKMIRVPAEKIIIEDTRKEEDRNLVESIINQLKGSVFVFCVNDTIYQPA